MKNIKHTYFLSSFIGGFAGVFVFSFLADIFDGSIYWLIGFIIYGVLAGYLSIRTISKKHPAMFNSRRFILMMPLLSLSFIIGSVVAPGFLAIPYLLAKVVIASITGFFVSNIISLTGFLSPYIVFILTSVADLILFAISFKVGYIFLDLTINFLKRFNKGQSEGDYLCATKP